MNTGKKIILLVGAMICLIGLGYFIYVQFSDGERPANYTPLVNGSPVISSEPTSAPEEQQLLEEFDALHSLDNSYLKLLSNAGTTSLQLDSLETMILEREDYLKKRMDSLTLPGVTRNQRLQNLAIFCNKVLDSRKMLRVEQGTGEESDDTAADDIVLTMLRKNARILDLENQLKEEREMNVEQIPVVWEEKIREKDQALSKLQQKYQALEQDFRAVQAVKPDNTAGRNPAKEAQQEKVSELEAALRLATVDCNLTRADGRAIIYTSKQRKVLLEESLKILQGLSASNNAGVQQQVKERMAGLKEIASTIRD